jgi:hypothetical protein
MAFTPRKEEIAPVVEILQSDGYASPEAMAKAVLKEAFGILEMRDWFLLLHDQEQARDQLVYGPFASENDVVKSGELLGGMGGTIRLGKVYGVGKAEMRKKGKKWPGNCTCLHVPEWHAIDGSSRGKCRYPGCECKKFSKIT